MSDFDGTLAHIVREPDAAAILPAARRALRALAAVSDRAPERLAVAILSGRTAGDVARRARVGGVRYLGSHGIEEGRLARRARPEGMAADLDPELARLAPLARALGEGVAERLGRPPWLFVEHKGPSVGLHYRRAVDPDTAREALLVALEAVERELGVEGLARLESRRVVELRPTGAGGKGAAVERLVRELRPGAVLVLGDDRTDADAFAAIRARRARGELDALLVGVHGAAETPPEVIATADLLVASPSDAAAVLAAVARAVSRGR